MSDMNIDGRGLASVAEVAAERKKRGPKPRDRSAAGLSIDASHRAGLTMDENADRDPNADIKAERVRIPFGTGQDQWLRGYQLDTEKFHYHLFHESQTRSGRIAQADGAFYEHCTINGENITRPSGSGVDYLMRLPLNFYKEDMARDRDQRKALEQNHAKLEGDDKVQEYGFDEKGRHVFEGTGSAKQHTTESGNPYAD